MRRKKLCARKNQANRTKNPNLISHHSGPCPPSYRVADLLKKEHMPPFVQAALDAYFPSKNAKDQVDKLKTSLEEITQRQDLGDSENAETVDQAESGPLSFEEQRDILIQCFGERRGTEVQGLGGAGTRPAKKRGGLNAEVATKRIELEERARKAEEDAQKARKKSEKAEEAKQANHKSDKVMSENEVLKNRVEALGEFMTTFAKSQAPSQAPSQATSQATSPPR